MQGQMSGNLPIILGVDPGSICGWALLLPSNRGDRYYLRRYGQATPTMTRWVHSLLANIVDNANDRDIVMAIEGQYIPKGYGSGFHMSKKSIIGLILNRARWQVIAELLGIKVIPVSPLKWQGSLLGANNKINSDKRKMMAKKFVEGYFSIDKPDEHETDAICVAIHEARMHFVSVAQKPRPAKGERRRGKKV